MPAFFVELLSQISLTSGIKVREIHNCSLFSSILVLYNNYELTVSSRNTLRRDLCGKHTGLWRKGRLPEKRMDLCRRGLWKKKNRKHAMKSLK